MKTRVSIEELPQIIKETGVHIIVGDKDYYYFPFIMEYDGDIAYIYERNMTTEKDIDKMVDYIESNNGAKEKEMP